MAGLPSIAAQQNPRIVVGVSDAAVSNNSRLTLSTYALGSCVGVVAYDPATHAGGILHFMLPDSTLVPGKALTHPAMFADTGLNLLLRLLTGVKASPTRLRFLIAGGASMLGGADSFKIGTRNVQATTEWLDDHGFDVSHSIVGGQLNRTIHFEIGKGAVLVKSPRAEETYSLGR